MAKDDFKVWRSAHDKAYKQWYGKYPNPYADDEAIYSAAGDTAKHAIAEHAIPDDEQSEAGYAIGVIRAFRTQKSCDACGFWHRNGEACEQE